MAINEMLDEFLIEAREYQQNLDLLLMNLEDSLKAGGLVSREALDEIFRIAHTIKGSSAFMEFSSLNSLMHAMESLMSEIRSGKTELNMEVSSLFLEVSRRLELILTRLSSSGTDDLDVSDLISQLEKMMSEKNSENQNDHRPDSLKQLISDTERIFREKEIFSVGSLLRSLENLKCSGAVRHDSAALAEALFWEVMTGKSAMEGQVLQKIINALAAGREADNSARITPAPDDSSPEKGCEKLFQLDFVIEGETQLKDMKFMLVSTRIGRIGRMMFSEPSAGSITETSEDLKVMMRFYSSRTEKSLKDYFALDGVKIVNLFTVSEEEKKSENTQNDSKRKSDTTVRVSLNKLDKMMNLSGELIIARSYYNRLVDRFRHIVFESSEQNLESIRKMQTLLKEFEESAQKLSLATGEMQELIMKSRMIPVGSVLEKFRRVSRDLAIKTGKKVSLSIRGEDTELDKKVVDSLSEPLTHILRNAIDHGIELPADREQAGKNPEGHIEINAFNFGGQVTIEISDDGAGIDQEKVVSKAISQGILTHEQAAVITEEEKFKLIFLPGFSTRDEAGELSGRGVGMDVVMTMIRNVNGNVRINSVKGRGTKIYLNIPVSLSIMKALLVRNNGYFYALPLDQVVEVIKLEECHYTSIEGKRAVRIRDSVFFVTELSSLLTKNCGSAGQNVKYEMAVIARSGRNELAVLVEELDTEEEIVIKSLKDSMGDLPGISGASILGEGEIAFILDLSYLIERGLSNRRFDG